MKNFLLSTIFALALICVAAVSGAAQATSSVVFKGAATNKSGVKFADWKMTLAAGKSLEMTRTIGVPEAQTYYFTTPAGQNLFVKIVSKNPTVSFQIYDADGTEIGDSTTADQSWQGALKTAGEYKIVVSADKKGVYRLTVKLD